MAVQLKYLLRHERQFWVGRYWGRFKQTDTFTTATHNRTTGYCFRFVRSIPAKSTNKVPYTDSVLGDFELRQNSIFIAVVIPEARTSRESSKSLCSFFGQHHEPRVPLENSTAPIFVLPTLTFCLTCRENLNTTY